jgi:putative DNA primase/helicase
MKDRGKFIVAIITIIRAYIVAGEPEVCDPLGSYGGWNSLVRSPLIWLGRTDPVLSMEKTRREDPELTDIGDLFRHWIAIPGLGAGHRLSARQIAAVAEARTENGSLLFPELRDLLVRRAGAGGRISTKALGRWLTASRGACSRGCGS